jgi:F-type H+-transporting ATPase subunit gamma
MQTSELIKRQIQSAEKLLSVVKTMKILAKVSIRQYEIAVESLGGYYRTVEMGMQIVLRQYQISPSPFSEKKKKRTIGVIVFGAGQGMCGRFNELISDHLIEKVQEYDADEFKMIAIGRRIIASLDERGWSADNYFEVPGSIGGINEVIQDILLQIENWKEIEGINEILLFHHKPVSGTTYAPRVQQLLPLDPQWLEHLSIKKWETRMLPTYTMSPETIFKSLVRQYIFVSLFRSFAESLASEHSSRLTSMQAAEKKINERLDQLTINYRNQRQRAITEEVLDIMSGYEASKSSRDIKLYSSNKSS